MLLTTPPSLDRHFDLCVVGAGPLGLALTLEAAERGLEVLLLEAGPAEKSGVSAATGDFLAKVVDPAQHASVLKSTSSGIGGTSWLWGGRCVPFEPIDFERRSWVPVSGWPISYDDALMWKVRAAGYLGCGPAEFESAEPSWPGLAPVELTQQERWARDPKVGQQLGRQVIAHPTVSVLCDALVDDVVLSCDGGAVKQLGGQHGGSRFAVESDSYVLACGGLKTTRLLLSVRRGRPTAFGGPDGALGRYYAGHLTGSIADLHLASPGDFRDLGLKLEADGTETRRRFTFTPDAQRHHRLLNTAFYASNLPFSDPEHRSGALSLIYFSLRLPRLSRRFASEETLIQNAEPVMPQYVQHALNVIRDPSRTIVDLFAVIRRRLIVRPVRRIFALRNPRGTYALRYHAEQESRAENRVQLSGTTAPDGLPELDVQFTYSEQDVRSVLQAHELLDSRLRASGRGHLAYCSAAGQHEDAVLRQSSDGYHQTGTTRMSSDPAAGVVDGECKVHGVENLHVASTSIFPTAGEANPTFLGTCLAIRLAHHLADRARAASAEPGGGPVTRHVGRIRRGEGS